MEKPNVTVVDDIVVFKAPKEKVIVPEGLYPAVIKNAEFKDKDQTWGKSRGIRLGALIDSKKFPGNYANGICWMQRDDDGFYIENGTVTDQWITNILGATPEKLSLKNLKEKKCMIYMKHNRVKDKVYYNIEDILPLDSAAQEKDAAKKEEPVKEKPAKEKLEKEESTPSIEDEPTDQAPSGGTVGEDDF